MEFMKILLFHVRITKKYGNLKILHENYENHQNHRITREKQENNENHSISLNYYENLENRKIPLENPYKLWKLFNSIR